MSKDFSRQEQYYHMRTIRFTNVQIRRLCRAYNTGLFIHKITPPSRCSTKIFLRISKKCQNKSQFDKWPHLWFLHDCCFQKTWKKDYRKNSELSMTQIHSTQTFFVTANALTCDCNELDTGNLQAKFLFFVKSWY